MHATSHNIKDDYLEDGARISDFEETAMGFKALAHPARIQILTYLTRMNACCCNDLCDRIPLAQSTISQHLKILQQAGFIEWEAKGNCSNYRLVPAMFDKLSRVIDDIHLNAAQDICCTDKKKAE